MIFIRASTMRAGCYQYWPHIHSSPKNANGNDQCWTEGRSSTAVAEDLGPTAKATVAEVLGHSYGRRIIGSFPEWRLKCVFHYTGKIN